MKEVNLTKQKNNKVNYTLGSMQTVDQAAMRQEYEKQLNNYL